MTIKELYDYAKHHGCEKKELVISVECSDSWYSAEAISFERPDLYMSKSSEKVFINIET